MIKKNNILKSFMYGTALLAGMVTYAQTAHAQLSDEIIQLESRIEERLPEDLKPKGLVYHGFLYKPEITLETKYSDNILAQKDDTKSDISFSIKPAINIIKKFEQNLFLFGAKGEVRQFAENTDENINDYEVFAKGRLEANREWAFPFHIALTNTSRERSAPQESQMSNKPLDIDATMMSAGIMRRFNRLSLTLSGEYTGIKNEDGQAYEGSDPIIYSDNDRDIYKTKLRLSYDFLRGEQQHENEHILFTDLFYGEQKYKNRQYVDGTYSGVKGDHKEYGFLSGFQTRYKGLIFASIGAGYTVKDFKDSSLDNTNALNLVADISYNITPKLTLGLMANRFINEDNGFLQGVIDTNVKASADYELLHNLYLNTEAGYENYDFKDSTREDDDFLIGAGIRYHLSDNLRTGLNFNYKNRDSTLDEQNFDRMEVLFNITGAL